MLTDEDITKLIDAQKQAFVTRDDFGKLSTLVIAAKEDIADLKQDVSGLRESVQALIIAVDKLTKVVSQLHDEFYAITEKVNRHEQWIKQLAEKLGVKLGY